MCMGLDNNTCLCSAGVIQSNTHMKVHNYYSVVAVTPASQAYIASLEDAHSYW